jgi:maltoporin
VIVRRPCGWSVLAAASLVGVTAFASGARADVDAADTTVGQYRYTVLAGGGPELLPFEFHGYLRTGFGINGRGGDQDVFWLPMAGGSYRLGNETGTWGSMHFIKNWGGGSEPYVRLHAGLNFQTDNNLDWDERSSLRPEAGYVLIGNILDIAPDAKFWAGRRAHLLHNIHINQFVPFQVAGYGGGVEDINLCFGKLSVAYIGASLDSFQVSGSGKTFTGTDRGRIVRHTVDAFIHDIDVPLGKGMIWADVGYMPGGTLYANNMEVDPSAEVTELGRGWGVSSGFLHSRYNFFGGTNKFLAQYGRGINFGLRNMGSSQEDIPSDWVNNAWRVRVAEFFDAQPSKHLSMMASTVYEYTNKGFGIHWASAGVNPIWHLSQHFGIAGEAGIDYVSHRSPSDPDWNFAGYLLKTAIAPQIAPAPGFWSRPLVRTYLSYAKWSDSLLQSAEVRRRIGGIAHQATTHGLGMGIQVEAWW